MLEELLHNPKLFVNILRVNPELARAYKKVSCIKCQLVEQMMSSVYAFSYRLGKFAFFNNKLLLILFNRIRTLFGDSQKADMRIFRKAGVRKSRKPAA